MIDTDITGTAFRVDGSWYIRLIGEGGALLPLQCDKEVQARLAQGRLTQVTKGYISRDQNGRAVACIAQAVNLLGTSGPSADDDAADIALPPQSQEIVDELRKANPDWRMIEAASRAAVDNDPDAIRFSVDAAHIQRLGEQLVSKQETALSELIKNAYDADATTVSLDFTGHASAGGTLLIVDDGSGMTEQVIRSSWMRISTNLKEEEPLSPIYGRTRAGRKGIGRFSVQRLGRRLHFTSKPAGGRVGYRVAFDWDEAFRPGVSLADVFSRMERFDKEPGDQGTTLEIVDLRDAWSNAAIERVWKAVVLLQAPFPIAVPANKQDGDKTARDPGFHVVINDVTQAKQSEIFSIERSFLDRALARIEAHVDNDGRGFVRLRSDKLDIDEQEEASTRYLTTGAFTLESRYFIFETSLLGGMSQGAAASMGRDFGGIRIYRNGFRVQPYGEASDDWLALAYDTGRRNLLVPANNNNFFGHVSLSSNENLLLEETSSREGLIENEAFGELRDFTRWALEWAALRIAAIRQRKQRAGERNFISARLKPSAILDQLITRRHAGGGTAGTSSGTAADDEDLQQLALVARQYEADVEAKIAASIEYEEMLRILASLGLSISVFGHEIKGTERAVFADLILLADAVADLPDMPIKHVLETQHADLDHSVGRLFDIGGYIGTLMSRTESRELRDLSVKGAIDRFTKQFANYMAKQDVTFDVDVIPVEMRTAPMHAAEFDSVLLNFLTNSIKSMKRAKVADRSVRIEARRRGRYVALAFEDNGIGIDPEIRDRIFDPFFTTTMGEDDGVAGPGTGLGLKIVSDVAESYGGEAKVGTPSDGYTCRMEFTVLAADIGGQ